MERQRTMQDLVCDHRSSVWAYGLGRKARVDFPRGQNVRGDRLCPFSEGTAHRLHWFAGWRGEYR